MPITMIVQILSNMMETGWVMRLNGKGSLSGFALFSDGLGQISSVGVKIGTGRLALRRNWKDCGFVKVKSLSFGGAAGGKKQSLFERGHLSVKLTPVIFVLYNIIQI